MRISYSQRRQLCLLIAVATASSKVVAAAAAGANDDASSALLPAATAHRQLQQQDENKVVQLAGILDTSNFDWADVIFEVTMDLLNNNHEMTQHGWPFDDWAISDDLELEYFGAVADAACDASTALTAYWSLRPMHAVIGARCSGASIPLAWMGALENVPQISMSSTSAKLSDKEEFPNFSRVVSPDDERGQVGALVATLNLFGWTDRVNIITTDTAYAKDLATAFQGVWKGTVPYQATIKLDSTASSTGGAFELDKESLTKVLQDVPVNEARVTLLLAHDQHAYPILKAATEQRDFPEDTIWIGPQAWVGRDPPGDASWLPEVPGYIGVTPFRNRGDDSVYQHFVEFGANRLEPILTDDRSGSGLPVLPDYAAEHTVDAIVAMAKALSATPPDQRRNGTAVTANLRQLDFNGISGRVRFTSTGDRRDPQFSIFNYQRVENRNDADGQYEWVDIGQTGTTVGSASFGPKGIQGVCFADVGCRQDTAPDDTYPVPREKVDTWVVVVIPLLCILFISVFWFYRRKKIIKSREQKAIIAAKEAELDDFRSSVVGMCTAEKQYVPVVVQSENGASVDAAASLSPPPQLYQWIWRETDGFMSQHDASTIMGDPSECWVKYDDASNLLLETAYQEQGGTGTCVPRNGYTVDFGKMIQTKDATGFERGIRRVSPDGKDAMPEQPLDLSKVHVGNGCPKEIAGEPQMVLVRGDIIQISKQRDDNWAYGTKLYLADEPLARRLVQLAQGGHDSNNDDDDANVLADTGWFPMDVTRVPNTDDLATLQKSVGDTSDLAAPDSWDDIVDPSVVQRHTLDSSSTEYQQVVNAFLSSGGSRKIQIVRVDRIQNMAMWQSYVVKRKTVIDRDQSLGSGPSNRKHAQARFERRWLWHGTNIEVMDKIIQQGFNRSFCGRNATMYGKGVYFARDSSYSSCRTYAVPDQKNQQYILACSVVVGEYCKGQIDARTPDLRDATKNILYDSTVGLLGHDTFANPSIYVTYHDAQAYPEYLIVFRQ